MKRNEFDLAKKELDNSKVIAFPTETVMGLGVYYDDYNAYNLLNKIKERPEDKPYTLMLGDINKIKDYAYIDNRASKVISSFMPGEITILLPAKSNVPNYVTHNTGVIGIRVPNLDDLRDFLNYIDRPLLGPSANKSGKKPAMNDKEVKDIFNNEVSYIFEGKAIGGVPSTIVDLTNKEVKIYREGNIKSQDILDVIKE